MKKLTTIILLIFMTLTLSSCGNKVVKKSIEQAKTAIENKNYDKALASLDLALDEDSSNSEAKKLYSIVKPYKDSKKLYGENNFSKSKKVLDKISPDYSNYTIKKDVDNLKTQIKKKIKEIDTINTKISQLESLSKNKNYEKAQTLIKELNKYALDNKQKNKIEKLKTKVNSELAKIKTEKKAEQERIAERQKKESENSIRSTEYPTFTETTPFNKDGYVMYKGIDCQHYLKQKLFGRFVFIFHRCHII